MGRPPSNGVPAFRFTSVEVTEMDFILQAHHNTMPAREVLEGLAEKFSESPDRKGKITVQMKQVWNWFQNRRYAVRAKSSKSPGKLNVAPMPRDDLTPVKNVPQPPAVSIPTPIGTGKGAPDNSTMEFEAKSSKDGAWYDVASFLSHRSLETGDPDVLVRFAGFGPDEDEWVNIRMRVRPRSLPCESSECVAVLPGDLILCFQEGKEQALYFDAHILDAQRRRHDVRGCRCRFLVRYDHDQSEEIVPLRKLCRRPETDFRLLQLQKTSLDHSTITSPRLASLETMQKQHNPETTTVTAPESHTDVSIPAQNTAPNVKAAETISSPITASNSNVLPGGSTLPSGTSTNSASGCSQ